MQVLSIVLLCIISCVFSKSVKYENCGGNVTDVRVTPCDSEPCRALKGGNLTIMADFISNQKSEWLRLWVGAELGTISLPLPGLERDGCKDKNITCPTSDGQKQTFRFFLNILKAFPALDVKTRFEIEGEKGLLFCFKAPVKIRDPDSKS